MSFRRIRKFPWPVTSRFSYFRVRVTEIYKYINTSLNTKDYATRQKSVITSLQNSNAKTHTSYFTFFY